MNGAKDPIEFYIICHSLNFKNIFTSILFMDIVLRLNE